MRAAVPPIALTAFTLFLSLLLLPASSGAQYTDLDTWIDTDGDGLPDSGAPLDATIGTPVTFDIWWDGGTAVAWTNFLYFFSVGPGPDSSTNFFDADTGAVDVVYHIGPGVFFPEDNFSVPFHFAIGGFGFTDLSGVRRAASVSVRPIRRSDPAAACIAPLVDLNNPSGFACMLARTTSYGVFSEGTVTPGCYTIYLPPEACCFPDGSCVEGPPNVCVEAGGIPRGPGSSCANTTCEPDSRGACCIEAACVDALTEEQCASLGGIYQGDGSACQPNSCVTATESRSWGKVKALFR